MAILTSLYAGISGLNANGAALSVIGNNIANVNTAGFKASRASFADVLSQSFSGTSGRTQIGRGAFLSSVSPIFTQGSLEATSSGLDLGIDGDGFFLLKDSAGAAYFSRSGEFNISKEGFIVNPEGLLMQGYQVDNGGAISGTIDNMDVSSTTTPPNMTANVEVTANLDSRVSPINTGFDIDDMSNTSHFSTSISVYDSLGNTHLVTVYFTKVYEDTGGTGNYWQWNGVADGVSGGVPGTYVMATGYMQFDQGGALVAEDVNDMDLNVTDDTAANFPSDLPAELPIAVSDFNFLGGVTQNQAITFDFGTGTADGGTGLDGSTQFGSASGTLFQSQDGYASGSLKSLSINQDGIISGLFTNGQTRTLGQVVVGIFNNPHGLSKMGKNLYGESYESGQPIIGASNTSGRGRLLSNSLELSNVDLAEEFIKLITAQRGFQANSRVITTTDEMLGELVNLKR